MKYAVANNAKTLLAQALSPGDMTVYVESTDNFPQTTERPFLVSINAEIIEVYLGEGNTFSVQQRGCEGTVPAAHAAGDTVENRFTAGTYEGLIEEIGEPSASDGFIVKTLADSPLQITYEDPRYIWVSIIETSSLSYPVVLPPPELAYSDGAPKLFTIHNNTLNTGDMSIYTSVYAGEGQPWTITEQIDSIPSDGVKTFVTNGVMDWQCIDNGLAIGRKAVVVAGGVAFGDEARGAYSGVCINGLAGEYYGVAVGRGSNSPTAGVAIGAYASTEGHPYAFAKGGPATASRWGEEVRRIDFDNNEGSYSTVAWAGHCNNDVGATMTQRLYLNNAGGEQLTLKVGTLMGFTIHVTAYETSTQNIARWRIEGAIVPLGETVCAISSSVEKVVDSSTVLEWDVEVDYGPDGSGASGMVLILWTKNPADTGITWVARGEIEEVPIV